MIPLIKPYIPEYNKIFSRLSEVFDSGYIAQGEVVDDFEKKLGSLLDIKYPLLVNSGTSALHIALVLAGVTSGDEVISTALTAEPTNTSIVSIGAKVVFADVDIHNGLISPKSIEQRITKRTKAIMVVHYAGMVCDMDNINALSRKYNIPVIEDAAHALMSKYKGEYIGSNSRFTAFSFQAIKHLTTIDGGLLALKNKEDYERAKKLRWFGLDKSVPRIMNDITEVGFKYNMNNVNAAIGLVQLEFVDKNVEKYIENGKQLDILLRSVKGVLLPKYNENTQQSYWLYTILVERRDDFISMMNSNGYSASPLHLRNDRHSVFENELTLPNLDSFYEKYVHIPCGWWMNDKDIIKMVNIIKKGW